MKKKALFLLLWTSILFTSCGKPSRPSTEFAESSPESSYSLSVTEQNTMDSPGQTDALAQAASPEQADAPAQEASLEQADASSTEQDAFLQQESTPPSITLLMVGDILLHTPVEESALQEDGTYNFDPLFAHTSDTIQSADLALVNQEVVIGGEALGISGYPCFNAPFSMSDALADAGFDVICHATNHTLDKGKQGLLSCCENWTANYPDIAVLGMYATAEDAGSTPFLYTVKDEHGKDAFTIAILNYTYGTNGIPLPEDMPYAVDLLEEEKVISDIARAEELADFTIVCPHWGTEYRLTPDNSQEYWTQLFLEHGVDLVLGTHPHVIEPVEWVKDESTGQEMLVYYSLGNYVNWTSSEGAGIANRMVGGMAEVTLSFNEDDSAVISDYGVKALVCHLEPGRNGVTTYFLSEYTQDMAANNAIINQDNSFSLQYCINLCNEVWGNLWE